MRLFVAVWPPHEVTDTIAALDRPAVPGVRWTTQDQWHVTLRFLGAVADDLAGPLGEALPGGPAPEAVAGPATARLGRSILVVPVAGLDDLAAAVVAATGAIVAVTEQRPFRGHLTLARAAKGASIPRSLVGVPAAGRWRVGRVSLVQSHTHPAGARYAEVAGRTLDGGP